MMGNTGLVRGRWCAAPVAIGLVLILALGACRMPASKSAAQETNTLTVFAAASLTGAFSEIGRLFEADHPGVEVQFSFSGSQQLAQQLAMGAPADVYASADQFQMQAAIDAGRVESSNPQIFARNELIVVFRKDNPAAPGELADLFKPGLRLILAAQENPVGQYAQRFLQQAAQDPALGVELEIVHNNVVSYEQNVQAVWAKVFLGEGDAGIVYRSDLERDDTGKIGYLEIPKALNTVVTYPIATIDDCDHPVLAREFVDLVQSPRGQVILGTHGLLAVNPR